MDGDDDAAIMLFRPRLERLQPAAADAPPPGTAARHGSEAIDVAPPLEDPVAPPLEGLADDGASLPPTDDDTPTPAPDDALRAAPPAPDAPPCPDDLLADEAPILRRHERLRDWWRWFVLPEERLRLDREYDDLCPDAASPYHWYLVRPVRAARWWRRLPAFAPSIALGAAAVPVFAVATGRDCPLLVPVVLGYVVARLMQTGEFLTRMATARRAGLLQGMLLAGRAPRSIADECFDAATAAALHHPAAATLAGALAIHLFSGLRGADVVVFMVFVVLHALAMAAAARLDTPADQRGAPSPGEAIVRHRMLLLSLATSRHAYRQPRLLVGGLMFAAFIPFLLVAVGLFVVVHVVLSGVIWLVAAGPPPPGSQGDLLLLLGAAVIAFVGAMEVQESITRSFLSVDRLFEDLAEWP